MSTIEPYFRDYVSLQTGNDGEKGYPNLTPVYTFYDQDYDIKPGEITLIRTPESMYPYAQLNINDATFIKDGALGGLTPYTSDKIYKPIDPTSTDTDQAYLVTWLYTSSPNAYGVWLDRYYYPDAISRIEALSTSTYASLTAQGSFNPSFASDVQRSINAELSTTTFIKNKAVFDKYSDMVIQPNSVYYYDRIGTKQLAQFTSVFDDLLIAKDFSSYYNTLNVRVPANSSLFVNFDGSKYFKYSVNQINQTGSFLLKFDISYDWKNNTFHTLFGSKFDSGFSITNNECVTPFSFVFNNRDLQVYNSAQSLLYTLSFENNITDVLVHNHLDDYHVLTRTVSPVPAADIYKINSFGQIKAVSRIPQLSSYIDFDINNDYSEAAFLLDYVDGNSLNLFTKHIVCVNLNTLSAVPSDNIFARSFIPNQTQFAGIKYIPGLDPTDPNYNLYLFKGNNVKFDKNGYIFHLVDNKTIYREDITRRKINENDQNITVEYCTTKSVIYDYTIDLDGNLVVLHSNNGVTVIDSSRAILLNTNISNTETPYKIDFISEYTSQGHESYPVITYKDTTSNTVFLTKLNSQYQISNTVNTNLSGGFVSTDTSGFTNLAVLSAPRTKFITNYNEFTNNDSSNYISFNLKLNNYYNNGAVLQKSIQIPVSSLNYNVQSFAVRLDQQDGAFQVFKNGLLYATHKYDPFLYRFSMPITNDFTFGCTGFYNNQTLAQFLNQPNNYFVDSAYIENFKLYSSGLELYQVYPLLLENKTIDNLNLSIPCDQRNNIEEIIRTFTFSQPTNKSNNIDIIIKNTSITDETLKESIKNNILLNANKVLPADVNINDITFKN